jgi:macrolide transport system ATP-binding/permease protein
MAKTVMELLSELHHEGLSLILVTHDRMVARYADRMITVRDGRLVVDERLTAPDEAVLVPTG